MEIQKFTDLLTPKMFHFIRKNQVNLDCIYSGVIVITIRKDQIKGEMETVSGKITLGKVTIEYR